jgi:hypothetical protein
MYSCIGPLHMIGATAAVAPKYTPLQVQCRNPLTVSIAPLFGLLWAAQTCGVFQPVISRRLCAVRGPTTALWLLQRVSSTKRGCSLLSRTPHLYSIEAALLTPKKLNDLSTSNQIIYISSDSATQMPTFPANVLNWRGQSVRLVATYESQKASLRKILH